MRCENFLCKSESEFYNLDVSKHLCYECQKQILMIKREGAWATIKQNAIHSWNKIFEEDEN